MSNKSRTLTPSNQIPRSFSSTMQSKRAPLRRRPPSPQGAPRRSDCRVRHSDRRLAGFRPSFHKRCLVYRLDHSDRDGESVVTKDTKASGSTTTSVEASSKDSKSSNDAKDESKDSDGSKSKDDSESSNKESDKSSDSKKSDGQDGKKSGDKSAAQNTEPAILPMCLAVLLRAAASRLMEPPALMAEALLGRTGRLAGVWLRHGDGFGHIKRRGQSCVFWWHLHL